MKPQKPSKLTLQTQSIRTLSATDLGQVGGASYTLPVTSVLSQTIKGGTYTPSSRW